MKRRTVTATIMVTPMERRDSSHNESSRRAVIFGSLEGRNSLVPRVAKQDKRKHDVSVLGGHQVAIILAESPWITIRFPLPAIGCLRGIRTFLGSPGISFR